MKTVFFDGDAYAVLGVRRDAPPAEIRRAYLRAMKAIHPDAKAGIDWDLAKALRSTPPTTNSRIRKSADATIGTWHVGKRRHKVPRSTPVGRNNPGRTGHRRTRTMPKNPTPKPETPPPEIWRGGSHSS